MNSLVQENPTFVAELIKNKDITISHSEKMLSPNAHVGITATENTLFDRS
jgi:hypothetical protein